MPGLKERMIKTVQNLSIRGTVKAIESKSYVHRYLIASALSGEKGKVPFENRSDDVLATLAGIYALLEKEEGSQTSIACHNSGTTFRFLLPVAAALGKEAKFLISNALAKRPTEPLYETLESHGVAIKQIDYEDEKCIRIRGQLFAGEFEIPGYISSQFVSGLLFALPLLNGESRLLVKDRFHSKSYVDMTISVLREAGIEIFEEVPADPSVAWVYRIPGNQRYHLHDQITIEGDWTSAAVWLTAGALSGPVTCTGLNMESMQGDRRIVEILKSFGAEPEIKGDAVTVSKAQLKAIEIDMVDNPDIVSCVGLLASQADGETSIADPDKRRFAEYNRLKTIQKELEKLGADHSEKEMIVLNSYGDHRIAMIEAVAASIAAKPVQILSCEVVKKSYPAFFEDLERMQELQNLY